MSLCDCPNGPRCEAYSGTCRNRADWTCMVPLTWKVPPLRLGPKFFCRECWDRFCVAWRTPMKGIDRPPGADDDWRGSILDHLRHAQIAIAFQERQERERLQATLPADEYIPTFVRHYTLAQLKQWNILQQYHRDQRRAGT